MGRDLNPRTPTRQDPECCISLPTPNPDIPEYPPFPQGNRFPVPLPACGSALASPREKSVMWGCRNYQPLSRIIEALLWDLYDADTSRTTLAQWGMDEAGISQAEDKRL